MGDVSVSENPSPFDVLGHVTVPLGGATHIGAAPAIFGERGVSGSAASHMIDRTITDR
jgi:hypothetical protein